MRRAVAWLKRHRKVRFVLAAVFASLVVYYLGTGLLTLIETTFGIAVPTWIHVAFDALLWALTALFGIGLMGGWHS